MKIRIEKIICDLCADEITQGYVVKNYYSNDMPVAHVCNYCIRTYIKALDITSVDYTLPTVRKADRFKTIVINRWLG